MSYPHIPTVGTTPMKFKPRVAKNFLAFPDISRQTITAEIPVQNLTGKTLTQETQAHESVACGIYTRYDLLMTPYKSKSYLRWERVY